ncbi:helix-turn-helix protein [compost metagenome]|uniref:helix-turn-helix transcriptional regulator n=1 Tax=Pseudomonas sp. TNT2022 ID1044 TaxID=2942636 RepID=UPI000FB8268A|nr:helix-turn-helix transcriptional regulator [Pseudomonas sp. TNT2022 ID1044]MDD0994434.1 helix-turn-helix domain-containing protein [Pseudomonas sp. TNT2022 ID1044]
MNTITPELRKKLIEDIMQQHDMGNETLGTSIRRLRLEVTGFDQDTFATMCHMSTKALYMIENDKGNPTISTVEAILRKFGLRLGLTMRTTTTYTPPLGQHKLVSQSPARGSSPKRTYAGQLSRVTTRKATAQTKIKDGDKDPTK